MPKADAVEIQRLMKAVRASLDGLPKGSDEDSRKRYHKAAQEAVIGLVKAEGGKASGDGYACKFTLGGITASCTYGEAGALQNWLVAAERRIAKIEVAS